MTTKTIPSVAEVNAALRAYEVISTNSIMLRQPTPLDFSALKRMEPYLQDDKVSELARAMHEAQKAFVKELSAQHAAVQARARELSERFLTHLFGQPIPGEVTLPYGHSGTTRTFRIESLSRLTAGDEGISGTARVTTDGGRCGSTETFYTRNGQLYWDEPPLY